MNLDDIVSLADAARELNLSPDTLKRQAQNGRIKAKVVSKTWITTRQEIDRYRVEQQGRVGRPVATVRMRPGPTARVTARPGPQATVSARRGPTHEPDPSDAT